ncbi:MAG: SPOR domain-containing protein [Deltaproteobacteria bacterium]|nr:SPOR domain-containing protein [Deltaproteobacteria bacterium]
MLEQEKWKDRIEVSLDNRQIFLLFSASAVLLSLVFALGIVIGRRLTPAAIAAPKTDPLALLDQMAEPKEEHTQPTLSFPNALSKISAPSPAATPDEPAANPAKGQGQSPEPKLAAKKVKLAKGPAAKVTKAHKPERPKADKAPAQKKAVAQAAKNSKTKEPKARKAETDDNDGAGFTLQLSSFQDKHEAEQYIQSLQSKGHSPQVMPTKIPGRGLWYRVRVGRFTSWKAAMDAKVRFERDHQLIAYVARR